MTCALDSSVLVAALAPNQPFHEPSLALLLAGDACVRPHALVETYSVLTGGGRAERLSPAAAARVIRTTVAPRVRTLDLTAKELLVALDRCQEAGVRGGAVYDWLHLVVARKAGAEVLYTLDTGDFRALARAGDPEIRLPNE